jgi:Peptidase A4 family
VSPGAASASVSTWIGIDGWNSTSLIQTGTATDFNASNGTTHYFAWFEVLPAQQTEQVQFDVSAGDAIYAAITQSSSTQWLIVLVDRTNGRTITTTQTYSGPQNAADFVQEAPTNTSTNTVLPLAKFATLTFLNARVNSSPPGLTSSQTVTLVQNGTQVSTPSVPNEAQNGFNVANGAAQPATPITPVFQLHNDGTLWASTGVACSGASCPAG